MVIKNSFRIFFLFSVISINCFSQPETKKTIKYKIGIGGWQYQDNGKSITCSFSKILNKENELCFPFYYGWSKDENFMITGVSYYSSVFKKVSAFDLFLTGEFNLYYYWAFNNISPNADNSRFATFLTIGLVPTINITRRISVSLEYKIGYGYMWAKTFEYVYPYYSILITETGWHGLLIPSVKLNYKF